MAIIKYSIGQITHITDKEGVENIEVKDLELSAKQETQIVVCGKCGLQHMIVKGEDRICCDDVMRAN